MTSVGAYTLQTLLDDDGVTQIYAAEAHETGLPFHVVCFPRNENLDPEVYVRLQRECSLVAAVEGAPLWPIQEMGMTEECFYYVMPVWGGGTLAERLQKGSLHWDEVIFIMQRLAQALHALHGLGIVHGDIKPSHVYFDAQGRPFLGGIGRLKILQAEGALWPAAVTGALGYRSPERDVPDQPLTPAGDVYALGALAFEMLGGKLPFDAATPLGWRTQHLLTVPADIRSLRPDVPETTARAIQRALSKDPQSRFASVLAFAEALSGAKPVTAPGKGEATFWEEYFARRLPRPSVWKVVGLPVTMLLISLVFVGLFLAAPAFVSPTNPGIGAAASATVSPVAGALSTEPVAVTSSPPMAEVVSPSVTASFSEEHPTASPTPGNTIAPENTPTPQAPMVVLPNPGTATPTATAPPVLPLVMDTPLPVSEYQIQYGDTIFTIAASVGLNQGQFMGANDLQCDSRLYPGKTLLVPPPGIATYTFPDTPITAGNINTLQPLYVPECVRDVGDVAFSPDGQVLAIASQNDIFLWLVDEWRPWRLLKGHRVPVARLRYSPDGTVLVSASENGELMVWKAADGAQVTSFRAHNGKITDLAFSPDGQWLVSTSLDRRVIFWQTSDWSTAREERGYAAYSAAFSPDGSLLAIGYSDRVALLSADDFSEIRSWPAETVPYNLAFSLDGLLLASNSDLWQVSDGRHIYHWPGTTHRIAFTSDGLGLVIGQKVWRISNGLPLTSLELGIDQTTRTAYAVDSIAFSSDYRMLAVGTQDGVVVLGLPQGSGLRASTGMYRLLPGDNYFNVAAAFDVPLPALLDVNKLTCEHVPFVSQPLRIPDPEVPWVPQLLPLYPENLGKVKQLQSLSGRCAFPPGEMAFSPAGDTLVSGLSLWSLAHASLLIQGTDESQLPLDTETVMPEVVLRFSPDGSLVAEPNKGDILLWSASDGRLLRTIHAHEGRITALAFDVEGQVLASASVDKTIHLWRVSDGTLLDSIAGYTAENLAFVPDGTLLMSDAGDMARFWPIALHGGAQITAEVLDKQSGKPRYTAPGLHWARHLSPDGSYLGYVSCQKGTAARCTEQAVTLFSLESGVIKHTFPGVKEMIQDFVFSPDSTQVAIATENVIAVWDIASETQVAQLVGDRKNAEYIDTLFYTPDGQMIVTMVNQEFLRFWDVASEQEAGRVSVPGIRAVAMSPDQYMLSVLVGDDITLWGVRR